MEELATIIGIKGNQAEVKIVQKIKNYLTFIGINVIVNCKIPRTGIP